MDKNIIVNAGDVLNFNLEVRLQSSKKIEIKPDDIQIMELMLKQYLLQCCTYDSCDLNF